MEKELEQLLQEGKQKIKGTKNLDELQKLQIKYLGKKSQLNSLLKGIQNLNYEQRITVGQLVNKSKKQLNNILKNKKQELETKILDIKLLNEKIDLTLPGYKLDAGNYHPLNLIINEISQIFQELGYDIIFGPEIEEDEYNFQRLNLPIGHPARDMQDTFYCSDNILLRTHCTNITARSLSNMKNDDEILAIISSGNTYRRDNDTTHSHQFMQIDGFLVAPRINFANLKWTLKYFCQRIFGEKTEIRMRPSFFPFTEPSVEVDVKCICYKQKGCAICKYTGWIEILGAGMINPLVFEACGRLKDSTGFAFGMGIERIAMIKYGIDDIRHFYTNDIRFLSQFKNFN